MNLDDQWKKHRKSLRETHSSDRNIGRPPTLAELQMRAMFLMDHMDFDSDVPLELMSETDQQIYNLKSEIAAMNIILEDYDRSEIEAMNESNETNIFAWIDSLEDRLENLKTLGKEFENDGKRVELGNQKTSGGGNQNGVPPTEKRDHI